MNLFIIIIHSNIKLVNINDIDYITYLLNFENFKIIANK